MYVVVGANGFLGSYVIKAILDHTDENIIATARDLKCVKRQSRVKWMYCDIQSDNSVDDFLYTLRKLSNLKMIYLAAYHHPDQVELNRELAWDINVTSLSKFLNKVCFIEKFFYASTDCVYGDSINGHHFVESDTLTPVNFYGHNKCAAEALTIHLGRNVVRFPFMISPSLVYKPHFYDYIVKSLNDRKPFDMFVDSFRSSLSFENAGILLIELMKMANVPQIINVCGDKDLSKYDVGLLIAQREGLDTDLIIPVSIDTPKENFSTKRAVSTLMDNNLLKNLLDFEEIDIFNIPIKKRRKN